MIIQKNIAGLKINLADLRAAGKSIGFVPTMGALHEGHLSLVKQSVGQNDATVCSIYINPTQFNNTADLQLYPVKTEADIDALENAGVHILFLPGSDEMYPANEQAVHYDLGDLENILEGKYRPGHFQGVCRIVDKLLSLVNPDNIYLGRKDYQQCLVIASMMAMRGYKTGIQICDTVRENDGLAMSSRNLRLEKNAREKAPAIYRALLQMKERAGIESISQIKADIINFLRTHGFAVDYAEIADAENLTPVSEERYAKGSVALIAAQIDGIRLIDNMLL